MNNEIQPTDIVRLYTQFFNIESVSSQQGITLYSENQIIARVNIDDLTVFEYKQAGMWNKCKTTDLIALILHNCPLHGE